MLVVTRATLGHRPVLRELASIASEPFNKLRTILFGIETDPRPNIPTLDSYEAGIALDIRSFESATFLADVTKGAYQVHSLQIGRAHV